MKASQSANRRALGFLKKVTKTPFIEISRYRLVIHFPTLQQGIEYHYIRFLD